MPKSKRDKKISLTRTKKKGLEMKQQLVEKIRDSCDQYSHVYMFTYENMRNVQLKEVRQDWKQSRFYFGKNKVMSLALGRSAEDEYKDNLHKLTRRISGQTGMLFTNSKKDEVIEYFDNLRVPDYARSGAVATQTVTIDEGPLPDFSHSMEPQLRQLGLPTALKKGVITLLRKHKVCNKGSVLTPEQARILKLFGHQMAEFHITIETMWQSDGKFRVLKERQEPIRPTKVTVKPTVKGDGDNNADDSDDDDDGEDVAMFTIEPDYDNPVDDDDDVDLDESDDDDT